jgi:hypothetical protein
MDVNNSKIRLEKRRQAWEEALDALTRLNRYDSDGRITQAYKAEREAWRKFAAAAREYTSAILESIGR